MDQQSQGRRIYASSTAAMMGGNRRPSNGHPRPGCGGLANSATRRARTSGLRHITTCHPLACKRQIVLTPRPRRPSKSTIPQGPNFGTISCSGDEQASGLFSNTSQPHAVDGGETPMILYPILSEALLHWAHTHGCKRRSSLGHGWHAGDTPVSPCKLDKGFQKGQIVPETPIKL